MAESKWTGRKGQGTLGRAGAGGGMKGLEGQSFEILRPGAQHKEGKGRDGGRGCQLLKYFRVASLYVRGYSDNHACHCLTSWVVSASLFHNAMA